MKILKKLEQALDQRVKGIFAAPQEGSREAIELYRDALNQVAARATASARAGKVLPFDRIRIELGASSAERRAVLEAIFEPVQMREDIRAGLLEERISTPDSLEIRVDYPAEAVVEMRLFFEKAEVAPKPVAPPTPPLRLVVVDGAASDADLLLKGQLIQVGRAKEVLDTSGRIVRRNQFCFPDELNPELNSTVSRVHAHLRCSATDGEWRIFDDGSAMGTVVFREGLRVEVPAHATRGVGLRAGDEIYFGSVRVRVEPA